MKKILISLIAGVLFTLVVQGNFTVNVTTIFCSLIMSGLVYFIFFVQFTEDEVEILEEYKRGDDEDPEEILP